MLVREGNKIVAKNKDVALEKVTSRKDELFGGLIGKVNATSKDNAKVIQGLENRIGGLYPMDIKGSDFGFTVYGSFVIGVTEYSLVIGERSKDKIVIELYEKNRTSPIAEVTGLTLNPSKIANAVVGMLENKFKEKDLNRMKKLSVKRSQDIARQEKIRAAEREAMLKELKDKEKEKELDKKQTKTSRDDRVSSSKDWVEINPKGNAWIIDPARL